MRDSYDRSIYMLDQMREISYKHPGESGLLVVGGAHLIDFKAGDRKTAYKMRMNEIMREII